jgi:hypothetical protein
MAKVVKRGTKTAGDKKLKPPTKKSVVADNLTDFSILLFGERKIGKTTLCAQFPDAFFLMCEPGGKSLEVYQPTDEDGISKPVENWEEFLGWVSMLEENDRFNPVVIDTVDKARDMAFTYVCKREGVEHPTDAGRWESALIWNKITKELMDAINRLLTMRRGLILISHAQVREIKTWDERTFDKLTSTLSGKIGEAITSVVDLWAYYGYEGKKRSLIIRGDSFIDAGCRLKHHFKGMDKVPMGKSEEEAYGNLMAAFSNELKTKAEGNGKTTNDKTVKIRRKKERN